MGTGVKLTFGIGLFAAVLGGGRMAAGPLSAMRDAWDVCEREARRSETLEQQLDYFFHRMEVKDQIICDVVNERLTLDQALARFRELYREHPEELRQLSRMQFGVATDEEVNRKRVLTLVEWELQDRKSDRANPARRWGAAMFGTAGVADSR